MLCLSKLNFYCARVDFHSQVDSLLTKRLFRRLSSDWVIYKTVTPWLNICINIQNKRLYFILTLRALIVYFFLIFKILFSLTHDFVLAEVYVAPGNSQSNIVRFHSFIFMHSRGLTIIHGYWNRANLKHLYHNFICILYFWLLRGKSKIIKNTTFLSKHYYMKLNMK